MIYSKRTKIALLIMWQVHKEQVDKGGMPYVFHPFSVAQQMETEEETVVALLHDVIEDSKYTLEDIKYTFEQRGEELRGGEAQALKLLTRNKEEDYSDYVERIKWQPIARKVKIADLKENLNTDRMGFVDELHIQKYRKALKILED